MVSVASNGVQSKQDLKGLSFVPRGTFRGGYRQDIRMLYESLSGAGCVSPCFEVACNGVHGRILNVDEASGHMTCQLDMMFTKPYCRHPAGLNCPEPPPANP